MKAEQIARIIIDESKTEDADKIKIAVEQAHGLIKKTVENVGTIEPFKFKLATWSGALNKWKSVVALVRAEDPTHPIFVNIFGAVLTILAPNLFSILVEHQVFIGYQLTQKEKLLITQQRIESLVLPL